MPNRKDIDDILDAALDELEDDSDDGDSCINDDDAVGQIQNSSTSNSNPHQTVVDDDPPSSRPMFGPPRPPPASTSTSTSKPQMSEEEKAVMDMMKQMENLFPSDFGIDGTTHVNLNHGKKNEPSQSSSSSLPNNESQEEAQGGGQSTSASPSTKSKSNSTEEQLPDMNDAVTQLLQKLSNEEGFNDANDEDLLEGLSNAMNMNMTDEMRKEFEATMKGMGSSMPFGAGGTGSKEEEEDAMGSVVDGMMKQLLSKDFMYEPMKDICEKFPKWLAENKDKLSAEDYEKHGKQYQSFQKLVHLYEHDPDNTPRLTELMNDLQEYGQPPAEIIQELAPGLEFDEEGMPKVDGLGGAPMPGMNGEECVLM